MIPPSLQFLFLFIVSIQISTRVSTYALLVSPTTLKLPASMSDDRLFSSLRDKVIVFIGDSVTRYQYLNLAVAIERKRWPNAYDDDEELPGSVCVQPKYKDFNEFFLYTSNALNGNEMCDCWRTKNYNYENRRYFNPGLNVSLVFIFLGRTMPQLRQDFKEYPFKRICDFSAKTSYTHSNRSHPTYQQTSSQLLSTGDLQKCSGKVLQAAHPDAVLPDHGAVLYNVTTMFQPDIAIINWGHHSPFEIIYKSGKWVYETMTRALATLNMEMNNRTRFVWKTTTPACHHDKANRVMGQCSLTSDTDSTPPVKVGNLLVYNHFMEMFNAHDLVTTLDHNIKYMKRRHPIEGEAANNLTFEHAMPLFVDDIHLHCWVNTELNKALLTQLFFQMK